MLSNPLFKENEMKINGKDFEGKSTHYPRQGVIMKEKVAADIFDKAHSYAQGDCLRVGQATTSKTKRIQD